MKKLTEKQKKVRYFLSKGGKIYYNYTIILPYKNYEIRYYIQNNRIEVGGADYDYDCGVTINESNADKIFSFVFGKPVKLKTFDYTKEINKKLKEIEATIKRLEEPPKPEVKFYNPTSGFCASGSCFFTNDEEAIKEKIKRYKKEYKFYSDLL